MSLRSNTIFLRRSVYPLMLSLLLACACHAQIPDVSKSQIDGNVPSTNDFRRFLIRDLTAYLKPTHADKLTVDYELLREGATQSGVAYPKFYLWLRATNAEKAVIEGAVRVAAIDEIRFDVTDFVPRSEIVSHPERLTRIFPQALLEKIYMKAGVKKLTPQTASPCAAGEGLACVTSARAHLQSTSAAGRATLKPSLSFLSFIWRTRRT